MVKRSSGWKTGALLATALALVGIVVWWFRATGESQSAIDPELISLKNQAIAELENEQFGDSDSAERAFETISKKLPRDPLGPRNLVVHRLLKLKRGPSNEEVCAAEGITLEQFQALDEIARGQLRAKVAGDVFAKDLVRAREAWNALAKIDPNSPATKTLSARIDLAEFERDRDSAGERLSAALNQLAEAAQATDAPAEWYELFETLNANFDSFEDADGKLAALRAEAIEKAATRAPDNLRARIAWVKSLAESSDARGTKAFLELADRFAAVADSVNLTDTTQRSDLQALVESCRQSAAEGDVKALGRGVARFETSANPLEIVKSDLARLRRHELDFVVFEFQNEAANVALSAMRPPSNAVASANPFTTAPRAIFADSTLRDLQWHDMDLDGRLDAVAICDAAAYVLSQSSDQPDAWKVVATVALPPGTVGCLAIDLERYSHEGGVLSFGTQKHLPRGASPPGANGNYAYSGCQRSSEECDMGPLDLVAYGAYGARIFRNVIDDPQAAWKEGDPPAFAEIDVAKSGLDNLGPVDFAVSADFDHDADLDLIFVGPAGVALWGNLGIFAFSDFSRWSQLPPASAKIARLTAVDWDRDLDLDFIACGGAAGQLGWLENLRHGVLRWRTFDADPLVARLDKAERIDVAELDGNVSWDLIGFSNATFATALTATQPNGRVKPIRGAAHDGKLLVSKTFDADNDGAQDVVGVDAAGAVSCWLAGLDGSFDRSIQSVSVDARPAAIDAADYDADGDLDLVVVAGGKASLVENTTRAASDAPTDRANWLALCAVGLTDNKGRANNNGIGSLLEIRAGGRYQAQIVSRQHTHFGLGAAKEADVARIVWTNGMPQTLVRPRSRQSLCELMFLKGSCPYLYAWNGKRVEFVTDCLWAAPIGLQVAPGTLAPCRPWEYLLIPGEALAPRDGVYDVRLTEELWEAAYFDHVELIAVDHPSEVSVWSNEKVGPPDIAEYKVHTVRNPRRPKSAIDQQGRDVSTRLAEQDDVYVKPWDKQIQQGLVEPHYLELDLGPLTAEAPQRITLFLTGWIWPTDTSININLAQNPEVDGPRFPYVLTPDAQGVWQERHGFVGFPGGKTKTIAIDLSNAFPDGDYRVRIASTAQLYWDAAFFTVDEEPAPITTTKLAVHSAYLRYRGFSRTHQRGEFAPDWYDYEDAAPEPKWPPMKGLFTGYGDALELLRATDDRMVAMGSGDELALTFLASETPPLPPGWKRDFLLHSIGWDKDADLHTLCGQDVGPMPFVEMTSYPPTPALDESSAAWGERQRRLETGLSRPASWSQFWRALARP